MNFKIEKDMKFADYYNCFAKIADKLLNGCCIVLKNSKNDIKIFRICEIEFYFNQSLPKKDQAFTHIDNFAHCDNDQLKLL